MKTKRAWMAAVAAVSLSAIVWAQAPETKGPRTDLPSNDNYLPNPGFEEETLTHWAPWVYGNKNGQAVLDKTVAHSGKASMRFEYKKDADIKLGSDLWMENFIKPVLEPGKTYTMSGWIKVGNIPPGKKGPIGFINVLPSGDGSPGVAGPTDPKKNDGWVFVFFHFKGSEKAGAYQFRCSCSSPDLCGNVWFDDLKVEEGTVPTAFRPEWVDDTDFYSREATIPWLPLPEDYRASMEVVTPHLEFGKPLAGGGVRLLWAGFYNNARMAPELAERGDFALDSTVFNAASVDASGVKTIHQKCAELFRQRCGIAPASGPDKAPQALVIEQSSLELLVKKDRMAIVERVRQGMGCVVLLGAPNYEAKPPTPKIREMLDAAAKIEDPGHGLMLTVTYPVQNKIWGQGTFGIEQAYSDVIAAVCKSVNRAPMNVAVSTRPAKVQPGEAWKAVVSAAGAAATAEVRVVPHVTLRDYDGLLGGYGITASREPLTTVSAEIAEGEGPATLTMPGLAAGEYIIQTRLLDNGKRVLGWALSKLIISSGVSVTKIDAGSAMFTPENHKLAIACTIRNDSAPIEDASIFVRATDPLGRILANSAPVALALKKGDTPCKLDIDVSYSELCSACLTIFVKSKDKTLAQGETWASTERLMPRVDFHAGPYNDFTAGARDMGADIVVAYSRPDLGLRPYTWVNFMGSIGGEDHTICDPAAIERGKKDAVAYFVENNFPLHVVGCVLHDELDQYGFRKAVTEHDLAFFRSYLKDTYKTLEALNTSWGTACKDWSEINAEPTKINFVSQPDRNPAPWADWHAASEQAAYRFYGTIEAAVRERDPEARIGPSGTRDTLGINGVDWYLLAKVMRSVSLYDGIHGEMYRSFAQPDHYMTRWSHFTEALVDGDFERERVWGDLLVGRDGTETYGGRYSNIFFPDYRPKIGATSFFEELAIIRNGFGRLIHDAKRDDADVAIFYSPASYRARIVRMKDNDALNAPAIQNGLALSLSGALNDLRVASHFIAYEQVARGELKPGAPKVLFLWGALALSDAEATAIRKYAMDGGVVVSEEEPGVYDEHCHKLGQGKLHDLFNGAVGTVTDVGKGKTMLFGSKDINYMRSEGYGAGGEATKTLKAANSAFRARLLDLFNRMGAVKPSFSLVDEQGKEVTEGVTAFCYTDGAARYVGVVPEGQFGDTLKARLTIRGEGQYYDCRSAKYLGRGGPQDVVLRVATGNVFALLPYKVEGLQVTAPATAVLGRPIHVKAALQTGPGPAVRHVLVVQLRRPDGKELPVNRWILETMNRSVEADLFLALNDPSGKWTLAVHDAATGVRQEQPIEVQPNTAF